MIKFITFSDERFNNAKRFCLLTAKYVAKFDKVEGYGPSDLDSDFKVRNARILSIKRGAGLWLWKPYVVKKAMQDLSNGDILFYMDSGAYFMRNIRRILKNMKQDIWACELPLLEKEFTKKECFLRICGDYNHYTNTKQIFATFFAIRKSDLTMRFVSEWLDLCQDYKILSSESNKPPLLSHREDQSIFSLLFKKYGFTAHEAPTLGGRHPEFSFINGAQLINDSVKKEYPISIIVHKKRRVSLFLIIKKTILFITPYSIIHEYAKAKLKYGKIFSFWRRFR